MNFIELCCGMGSVSLRLLNAPKPPISRFGNKTGYADAILYEMGLTGTVPERTILIDSDKDLLCTLNSLIYSDSAIEVANEIESLSKEPPRKLWEDMRAGHRRVLQATRWLLSSAGSRGGTGGFKGAHKLRPNVDGFIPSRISLAKRIREFANFRFRSTYAFMYDVRNTDDFWAISTLNDMHVYIDPPYQATTGYGKNRLQRDELRKVACYWASLPKVKTVCVSENEPLDFGHGWRHVDITNRRIGQCRTMSKKLSEWLTIFQGKSS